MVLLACTAFCMLRSIFFCLLYLFTCHWSYFFTCHSSYSASTGFSLTVFICYSCFFLIVMLALIYLFENNIYYNHYIKMRIRIRKYIYYKIQNICGIMVKFKQAYMNSLPLPSQKICCNIPKV